MTGLAMRALPEALVETAYRIFKSDPLHALDRLVASLTGDDLQQMAVIALRDGVDAAERFYRSRPHRFRRIGRIGLR